MSFNHLGISIYMYDNLAKVRKLFFKKPFRLNLKWIGLKKIVFEHRKEAFLCYTAK